MFPFNKPYLTGKETTYIREAVETGTISGNGDFTKRCHAFFEQRYGFGKCLLTTSCTDALEMAAILADIKPGEEVIVPSYTFVSTALAFDRQGAKVVFADSRVGHPNLDLDRVEELITPKTRAVVPVHYAGMACDMDRLMKLSEKHGFLVIEDAAHAIDAYHKGRALGGIGHMACFSFHESKNIICGEGGMLVVNDERFVRRAEVIWEKGTNRAAFYRGEVGQYGWIDTGSSFLPADTLAAFLFAQLEKLDDIQSRRMKLWQNYHEALKPLEATGRLRVPEIPPHATNNAHIYYLVLNSGADRDRFIEALKAGGVEAVFHYLPLHASKYYKDKHDGRELPNAERFAGCLVRLPMYYELLEDQPFVIGKIVSYFS